MSDEPSPPIPAELFFVSPPSLAVGRPMPGMVAGATYYCEETTQNGGKVAFHGVPAREGEDGVWHLDLYRAALITAPTWLRVVFEPATPSDR